MQLYKPDWNKNVRSKPDFRPSSAMDYQKKKLLTQSVAFLQAHLNLSNEFLEGLITIDVLTREEVITVQVMFVNYHKTVMVII